MDLLDIHLKYVADVLKLNNEIYMYSINLWLFIFFHSLFFLNKKI
jgi:hypothetical protein